MAIVNHSEPSLALRGAEKGSRNGGLDPIPAPDSRYSAPIPVKPVPYAATKRAMDIAIALFGLILFSPFFLIISILVKCTSRGPVIFRQTRVGVGGKLFTCYKFRSMCADAEQRKERLSHLNEASGPVFKIKNDPRLTPVGKWLRKLSLDELPQLWNVLKGDMSIVGPRPPVPHEVVHYREREFGRLAVRPGLTCLWQINGRSDIPFEHWVELDLLYIDTMSFWNDVKIVLKTVPAVVTGRGAR